MQGENLTKKQKYLGDQWGPYCRSSHVTTYSLLLLGSNDVDQFQRKLDGKARGSSKKKIYLLEGKMELNTAYSRIVGEINRVMTFLEDDLDATTYTARYCPGPGGPNCQNTSQMA